MKLTLEAIIINGEEVTVDEARNYLENKKIVLPSELAKRLIYRYIREQVKNPVPSNRVFK
jgi:hypothetical protein